MTGDEASSINTTISGLGGKGTFHIPLTLGTVIEWIKLQGFDEYTTNGLIEMASRYPNQALPHFRKNFNLMIQRVRQKRREEQRGMLEDEQVEPIESLSEGVCEEQLSENIQQQSTIGEAGQPSAEEREDEHWEENIGIEDWRNE